MQSRMGWPSLVVTLVCLAFPAFGCLDLWTASGNSCYQASSEEMTWYAAEQHCGREGAYMIEINDADEQASLFSFLPSDTFYWLGMTDWVDEGIWVWQNNFEVVNYTNWISGQPDNGDGNNEDCAHLSYNFEWNDNPCGYTTAGDPAVYIHALCEMENV